MSHHCRRSDKQCVQPFLYGEGVMGRTVELASCRGREHCQKAPQWFVCFRKSRCPFSLNRWPQQTELQRKFPGVFECLLVLECVKNKWKTAEFSDSALNFYCLVLKPQISSFLLLPWIKLFWINGYLSHPSKTTGFCKAALQSACASAACWVGSLHLAFA